MNAFTRAATLEAAPDRPIRAVLATPGKQADGIDLRMTGVDLSRFLRNPVLLVAHNSRSLPVGRVDDIEVTSDRITGRLTLADDEEGRLLDGRIRQSIIGAVSIGFSVTHWEDPQSTYWTGGVATEWVLNELSLVAVPMDENALVYARQQASVDAAGVRNLLAAFTPVSKLLDAFNRPAGGR